MISGETSSLSDYLDQYPLFSSAVEFAVENLFPRSEIQFAFGDCNHDFPAHDLTFEVGVSVIFAGPVVSIGGGGRVRREFFEPIIVILNQPALRIVDVNAGGDVHGVDQAQPVLHTGLGHQRLDLVRDVQVVAPVRRVEPKLLAEVLHDPLNRPRGATSVQGRACCA